MTKENAKQILGQSISNLHQRRGSLTSNDLEAEVINNACLYILKNQKDKMREGNTIEAMFMGALNATQDFVPIAKAFTEGAMELFPEHYTTKEAMVATIGIQQNVAWDGMWDFLRDYFQKNVSVPPTPYCSPSEIALILRQRIIYDPTGTNVRINRPTTPERKDGQGFL